MAKRNAGGMIVDTIRPGKFYRGVNPGGFPDAGTRIVIPGPIMEVSTDGTRTPIGVAHMPEPVQMPTHKYAINHDGKTIDKEIPFDEFDAVNIQSGLNQALAIGIIEEVDDDFVAEHHPQAWQNRREKYVFTLDGKEEISQADLIDKFYARQRQEAAERAAKEAALMALAASQEQDRRDGAGEKEQSDLAALEAERERKEAEAAQQLRADAARRAMSQQKPGGPPLPPSSGRK